MSEPARIQTTLSKHSHLFRYITIGKLRMHSKLVTQLCTLFCILGLAACKNYSVSLNDKVVYTPPSLFTQFTINDERLRTCVEQTIIDKHITKAEELKQLNCSNAGITNLAGLETFNAIEQLNLNENALTSISQLSKLTQLTVLTLQKNNLTNAEPLLHLLHLVSLDISENKNLSCRDLYQLVSNFHKGDLKVVLPEQCNTKT